MLNATLFGEMITFAIFVWVTMRYIMPEVNAALDKREDEVAAGHRAAQQAHETLAAAKIEVTGMVDSAKSDAAALIKQAEHRAEKIIEEAKAKGQIEKQKLTQAAQADIAQQTHAAKKALQNETAQLVMSALERFLGEELDASANQKLLDALLVKAED